VVVDEELSAKLSMADTKFSFQEIGRLYSPAWMSPEGMCSHVDGIGFKQKCIDFDEGSVISVVDVNMIDCSITKGARAGKHSCGRHLEFRRSSMGIEYTRSAICRFVTDGMWHEGMCVHEWVMINGWLFYFQIALEGLRVTIPPGIARNMSRLINICLNEDPGRRPNFDQIIPILEKMNQ
jgi:hypothetical protein